jgi:hypothetical protein
MIFVDVNCSRSILEWDSLMSHSSQLSPLVDVEDIEGSWIVAPLLRHYSVLLVPSDRVSCV